jgi:hypothetical protein
MAIINGCSDFKGFCTALFSQQTHSSLIGLLEALIQDKKSHPIISRWMSPHTLCLICDMVHSEMDSAMPNLKMNMANITPEFIENRDIHTIMEPVACNKTAL